MSRFRLPELGIMALFAVLFQTSAWSQQVDRLMNSRATGDQVYSAGNVSLYRKSNNIVTGKVHLYNKSNSTVRFQLFHSDAPGTLYSISTTPAHSDGYCSFTLANDWGIRFLVNGQASEIFFIGQVCKMGPAVSNPGLTEFIFEYSGTGLPQNEPAVPTNDNTGILLNDNEVRIGDQIWMSKNLNVDRFRNGDLIPESRTDEEWWKANSEGKPTWCYLNDDPANGKRYGKLYNYWAIKDPRGLSPAGWHIPLDSEWTVLSVHLGGDEIAGGKMKSTEGWTNSEFGKNGTNSSKWSGLPGGECTGSRYFEMGGEWGVWWCREKEYYGSPKRKVYMLENTNDKLHKINTDRHAGAYVRCVKD